MPEHLPLYAQEVSRSYGNFLALAPIELTIPAGQVVLLTGPNGAGKTTLLHCLSGLLRPSTGRVSIAGYDLYAEITVDGGMPQHGHGLPAQPKVTQDLGNGDYLVEGMKFNMPGWWTVSFDITANSRSDTITYNLFLE